MCKEYHKIIFSSSSIFLWWHAVTNSIIPTVSISYLFKSWNCKAESGLKHPYSPCFWPRAESVTLRTSLIDNLHLVVRKSGTRDCTVIQGNLFQCFIVTLRKCFLPHDLNLPYLNFSSLFLDTIDLQNTLWPSLAVAIPVFVCPKSVKISSFLLVLSVLQFIQLLVFRLIKCHPEQQFWKIASDFSTLCVRCYPKQWYFLIEEVDTAIRKRQIQHCFCIWIGIW